ncbi:MAG: penicillin-binding protein 2 [Pseudomonadales bacterium]|nr:penicillin-binding protein 2 [Pseudomonadales bacterium]
MPEPLHLNNPLAERRLFNARMAICLLLVVLMAAGLIARAAYLQLFQHDQYATLSDENRLRLQPVAPTRGLIYDRNGILLADNQPSFTLVVVRERAKDLDQLLLDLQEIIEISDREIQRFQKRRKRSGAFFASLPLKFKLSDEEIATLAVNQHRLPGAEIRAQLVRNYPVSELTTHVVGYVGRINERELKKIDRVQYSVTNHIGKTGIEKFYESVLHGQVGNQKVETDAQGRVLRTLDRIDPVPGDDIYLQLDIELQRVADKALEGRRGAVVAIEIESGGVLAMVSKPSFDGNKFVTGIDSKSYNQLRDSLDLPMFNRAIRGVYPPGSTIKPFIGLAGLDTRVVNYYSRVRDPGWYQLENDERFYRDWKKGGHGWTVNLSQAIIESCDTYFYDLSFKLGIDQIHNYLGQFGFGQPSLRDLPGEASATLPSRGWKKTTYGKTWYHGETLLAGIGQGYFSATPMQLATATATFGNKGKTVQARLLMTDQSSHWSKLDRQKLPDVELKNPQDWDYLFKSMERVVHSPKGTARRIGVGSEYRIAGKTGTAQVVGIRQGEEYDGEALEEHQRDHALFVGFAPVQAPKIAVAVVIENGEHGSSVAAPVARKLFDAYLLNGLIPSLSSEEKL